MFSYRKSVHLQMGVGGVLSVFSARAVIRVLCKTVFPFSMCIICVRDFVHSQGDTTRKQKAGSPLRHTWSVMWLLHGICPTLGTVNVGSWVTCFHPIV